MLVSLSRTRALEVTRDQPSPALPEPLCVARFPSVFTERLRSSRAHSPSPLDGSYSSKRGHSGAESAETVWIPITQR